MSGYKKIWPTNGGFVTDFYVPILVMGFREIQHQTIIFTAKMVFMSDEHCVLWSQQAVKKL